MSHVFILFILLLTIWIKESAKCPKCQCEYNAMEWVAHSHGYDMALPTYNSLTVPLEPSACSGSL